MITETQREEIRHALGLNYSNKITRNNFYTESDDAEWNDLVEKGYATKHRGWEDDMAYFRVTDAGKEMVEVTHEQQNEI